MTIGPATFMIFRMFTRTTMSSTAPIMAQTFNITIIIFVINFILVTVFMGTDAGTGRITLPHFTGALTLKPTTS